MIIDCISDLHGHYPKLEGGDLLIVAGDLTATDSYNSWTGFNDWMRSQDYPYKVFIAGNHDNFLQLTKRDISKDTDAHYLCDSGTEFEGLKIWGSPWTKRFKGENPNCLAFTCETEEELAEKWAKIPDVIDILVTHSPPHGMFDKLGSKENVGSRALCHHIMRTQPRLSVFGHVHEGYGTTKQFVPAITYIGMVDCTFVNASHVNELYEPVNKPIRIEL